MPDEAEYTSRFTSMNSYYYNNTTADSNFLILSVYSYNDNCIFALSVKQTLDLTASLLSACTFPIITGSLN